MPILPPAPRPRRRHFRPSLDGLEARALLAVGGLDPTFSGDGKATVDVAPDRFATTETFLQGDGEILAAGHSGSASIVARLNSNGTLDTSFGTNGLQAYSFGATSSSDLQVVGLFQQSDAILIVGSVDRTGSDPALYIQKLRPDGRFDTSFGGGDGVLEVRIPSIIRATEARIQPDGKLLILGRSDRDFTSYSSAIVRLDPAGNLDTRFGTAGVLNLPGSGPDGIPQAGAMEVFGGQIYVAGGSAGTKLARFGADGALDTSFGQRGFVSAASGPDVTSMSIRGDRIVLAGTVNLSLRLVRLDLGGSLDTGFGNQGVATISPSIGMRLGAVEVLNDGKILAAVTTSALSPRMDNDAALVRIAADGSIDPDFGEAGFVRIDFGADPDSNIFMYDSATAMAIQPDGKVVLAGKTAIGFAETEPRFAIARVTLAGSGTTPPDPGEPDPGDPDPINPNPKPPPPINPNPKPLPPIFPNPTPKPAPPPTLGPGKIPPQVIRVRRIAGGNFGVEITFDQDMGTRSLRQVRNYRIVAAGRDGRLGTRDDRAIKLVVSGYDTASRTVTLRARRSIESVGSIRLRVLDRLVNSRGIRLDGNANGWPRGDFLARVP